MVLPFIIAAGAGVIAVGSAVYSAFETDIINNYQTTNQNTYQQDYITNETVFDFSKSYFENGSQIDLRNYTNQETNKTASQEATQSQTSGNNTLMFLAIGAAAVGAYLYLRRKK